MRFQMPQDPSRSLEGHLLAASSSIEDPRFRQAVILILHHGDQGTLGIVLNRRLNRSQATWDQQVQEFAKKGPLLFQGGPVGGSMIVLQLAKENSEGVPSAGSIFMVQKPDQLQSIAPATDGSVRLFLGHAGWKSGQLEQELAAGDWHLLSIRPELFFSDGQQMWVQAIREVGCQFYQETLGISEFPEDATLN